MRQISGSQFLLFLRGARAAVAARKQTLTNHVNSD
jgi:hypothetical protein